jgi:adenosine deaminase
MRFSFGLTCVLLVGLSKFELFQLAQDAVQFVFADDVVKKSLKEVFKHAEKRLLMWDELAAPS